MLATEEAYYLFPENPGHRSQIANTPMHGFWNQFSSQVTLPVFGSNATRQGIYAMGPNAEFLGAHHGRARAQDVAGLMRNALARWERLQAQQGYAGAPIPPGERALEAVRRNASPGTVQVLRVSSRDLPREDGTVVGKRYHELPAQYQNHENFHRWAWNQDWFELREEDVRALSGEGDAQTVLRRLVRTRLVDNVRGQVSEWSEREIEVAQLQVRRSGTLISYSGRVRAANGSRQIELELSGEAQLSGRGDRFDRFALLAKGWRTGSDRFNFRRNDPGPAPIGFAVSLVGKPS